MSTLTRRAGDFLAEQARSGAPFYVQVSHYAVHLEIQHSAEAMARVRGRTAGVKHNLDVFAAMTEDLDEAVGRLVDRVDALGLGDRTYVIYMSDNGGRPTLPGAVDQGQGLNHPLRGGKGTLYEGGIRVPSFWRWRGRIAGGMDAGQLAAHVDVLPTLLALA